MRKISDILINEKLKLNKNSKVSNSKSFLELKQGDKLYYYFTYVEYGADDDDKFINNKIMSATITNVERYKDFFKKDFLYIEYINDFMNKSKHENHVNIPIEKLTEDTKIFYDNVYSAYTLSTDRELLENVINENIDKRIAPIQRIIDKLQDRINNILKLKEEKYYKEIDNEDN